MARQNSKKLLMKEMIDKINLSKGLPENLSTEAQLWDEILKKEVFLMPEDFFPLIKELHGKVYSSTTSIKPLATEYSAVLYMEDNLKIPEKLSCSILFQDHGSYSYEIPTLKIQSYSLNEIHQKHLYVLIPFLPIRFRKRLNSHNPKQYSKKEDSTSFFQELILILKEEIKNGHLNEQKQKIILSLLRKSMIRVFYKDTTLLKEVIKMTEPILELEFEKWERIHEAAMQELRAEKDAELATKDAELNALKKQLAILQAEQK